MHPFLKLDDGDNFVLSRRSHPTRFPIEIQKRRAELGMLEALRGLDVEQGVGNSGGGGGGTGGGGGEGG